jgi:hypothetical protein
MGGAVYHVEMDTREAFIHTVVTDIQVAAGAAPYSTVGELVDTFLSLADRIPDSPSQVDLMVLRRLFAGVTRRVYEHAGAAPPLRPVVNLVADADDPRVEFKAALAALRRQGKKSNGHNVIAVRV